LTERLILDVERLTFGFDALAHHDGEVVFLPYAAPGDRVTASVIARHRGYLQAEVDAVERPGPGRVIPGCAFFPRCGGCQWQHVAPPVQREAKAAVVAEQLARLAGIRDVEVLPTIASPHDWGYRGRVTLVVEGRRAGYHRARSHALVEITGCPIADPAISAHLDAAREWLEELRVPLRRITVLAAPGGVVLAGLAARRPGARDHAASEAILAHRATVRGTVLVGGGERLAAGDPTVRLPLEAGLDLEVPADVFTQVNPAANPGLVASVLALGRFARGEHVLDLYCGVGNFTLPLARRGITVEGIERDGLAVGAARENAARLGLQHASFRATSVAAGLATFAPDTVDALILDPPRAGAADAVAGIARLRPRRVLYVACDPSTLARDVRAFATHGLRIVRAQPIDLFPQTFHVETVAELHLT